MLLILKLTSYWKKKHLCWLVFILVVYCFFSLHGAKNLFLFLFWPITAWNEAITKPCFSQHDRPIFWPACQVSIVFCNLEFPIIEWFFFSSCLYWHYLFYSYVWILLEWLFSNKDSVSKDIMVLPIHSALESLNVPPNLCTVIHFEKIFRN